MPKSDRYYCHNRRKYYLKVHIVLVTKYRKPLLSGNVSSGIKTIFYTVAEKNGCKILAMETDVDHIHVLLEYDTTERICDIVKELKQKSTYYLWEQFVNVLKSEYWKKKIFWSDGYFACSIGEVSESTIHHYFYESFPDFFQQEKNAYSYTYTLLLEIVQEMVFSLRNHTMHEYPAFQLDKN